MKRRPLIGNASVDPHDSPRVRRDAASIPRAYSFPLRQTGDALEFVAAANGALAVDPSRGAYVRADPPLRIGSGSPYALQIDLAESLTIQDGKLSAKPVQDNLAAIEGQIARLQANKLSTADAAATYYTLAAAAILQAQVDALPTSSMIAITFFSRSSDMEAGRWPLMPTGSNFLFQV